LVSAASFEYFQPLVTVFVLAALLAFILNYSSVSSKRKVKRNYAVLFLLLTLSDLVAFGITLIPLLLEQLV